jgi:hypothetical protein
LVADRSAFGWSVGRDEYAGGNGEVEVPTAFPEGWSAWPGPTSPSSASIELNGGTLDRIVDGEAHYQLPTAPHDP